MRTKEEEERKNNVLALLYTALVCAVLFFVCAFTVVWTAPDPPIPEYGMEMDFGFDDVGSDDLESETENFENVATDNTTETEDFAEQDSEPIEKIESENNDITDNVDDQLEEVTADEMQADDVEPIIDEEEEIETSNNTEDFEKDDLSETEKVIEKETAPKKVEPKIDSRTLLGDNNNNNNNSNHGNGEVEGNIGNTDQKVDDRTILTKTKSNSPVQLDLPGWQWTSVPDKKDSSSEIGVVKIGFTIDAHGEVISTRIKYTDLSFTVAQFYQNLVNELEFQRTGNSNTQHSAFQYGSITFNIIAK